jgi:alkylation response protein AidB-like acyl-CoA dehydrogenase
MARCGCLGVIWGINGGATVGGPPLANYGTEEQKKKYLGPLLRGYQRHCLCVTEPAGMFDTADEG